MKNCQQIYDEWLASRGFNSEPQGLGLLTHEGAIEIGYERGLADAKAVLTAKMEEEGRFGAAFLRDAIEALEALE
jgi:hypothetical protein